MRTVKVFIAGSKELENERNCLKAAALDLNITYAEKKIPVRIQMFSYDNLDDTQGTYNKFIEEEADIVIFVVKDRMGDKTEVEFNTATESLKKHGRPKVMFFLHKYKKETPEIARIKGLVYGRLGGQYYVEYSSSEWGDFKSKVRERIERYVKDLKIPPTSPALKCRRWLILLCSIIGVLAVLAGYLIWQRAVFTPSVPSSSFSPVQLVLAGGGSVKNFIEEEKGINIVEYPHSVYLNMPSGNAWSLLAEEISREKVSKTKKTFSTICLSADEIDTVSVFSGGKKSLFNDYRIFNYYMGEDPLVVYVSRDFVGNRWITNDSSIYIDSLRAMLKYAMSSPVCNSVNVFTTTKSSGTLRTYQKYFTTKDAIDLEQGLSREGAGKVFPFFDNSDANYIRGEVSGGCKKPFIVLGCKYYYPKRIVYLDNGKKNVEEVLCLYVYDSEEHQVGKPINLYFLGKKDGGDHCTIKKPIVYFLERIQAEKNIPTDMWNDLKNGRVPVKPVVIVDLNGNGK